MGKRTSNIQFPFLTKTVSNVVATADLGQSIDLKAAGKLDRALFDLHIYHCVYFSGPGLTKKVSVFESGKMISIGTKSEKDAFADLRTVSNELIESGMISPIRIKPQLRNIVVSATLSKPINLPRATTNLENTIYEPDQFPGLIWRPRDFPGSFLLFSSGNLVIAGLKSFADVRRIDEYIGINLVGA